MMRHYITKAAQPILEREDAYEDQRNLDSELTDIVCGDITIKCAPSDLEYYDSMVDHDELKLPYIGDEVSKPVMDSFIEMFKDEEFLATSGYGVTRKWVAETPTVLGTYRFRRTRDASTYFEVTLTLFPKSPYYAHLFQRDMDIKNEGLRTFDGQRVVPVDLLRGEWEVYDVL
jgi:hypothetical protein